MKHLSLRLPEPTWDALHEALASGDPEAIRSAAQAAYDEATTVPQSVVVYRPGSQVTITQTKPVHLGIPAETLDGSLSIPVRLAWLKGAPWTEARGPLSHGRVLLDALLPIVADPETVEAVDALLGPRVGPDGHPVAEGGIDVRNPSAAAIEAAVRRKRAADDVGGGVDSR